MTSIANILQSKLASSVVVEEEEEEVEETSKAHRAYF